MRGYLTSYASLFREQSTDTPHINKIEIVLRSYNQMLWMSIPDKEAAYPPE
jgi:hypothetical protein